MKLRPYTPEETDELISKFSIIAEYCYSINAVAYTLVMDKFFEYNRNFKKSLFTWKPMSYEDFVKSLSDYHNPRFCEYTASDESYSLFVSVLFTKDGTFFNNLSYFSNFNDGLLTRYGIDKFNNKERELLSDASSITEHFFYGYDLREKYNTLMKYAHRPFEFDESYIKWLEQIERFYNKAIKWNSN